MFWIFPHIITVLYSSFPYRFTLALMHNYELYTFCWANKWMHWADCFKDYNRIIWIRSFLPSTVVISKTHLNILLKFPISHIVKTVFSICSRFNQTPKNHFHYQEWIIYTYGVSLQLPILNCVLDSCFCILAMKLLEWWKLFLFLTLFMILGGVHLKLKQHIDISNCYTNVITDISSG